MAHLPGISNDRFQIKATLTYAGNVIYSNDDQRKNIESVLNDSIEKSIKRIKIIILCVLASAVIGGVNPMYVFIRDGVLYTLTGVAIPFAERGSHLETTLNMVYQSYSLFVAFIGCLTIQITTGLHMNQINVLAGVTDLEMAEFSAMLEKRKLSQFHTNRRLLQILKQIHQGDK